MPRVDSWGKVLRAEHTLLSFSDRYTLLPALPEGVQSMLPYGNGRSYGDSCLNPEQALLKTRNLDHFIHFDPGTGVISCEAGVLLSEILDICVPQGWFLPVTPGTRFVTVGGAIANDVHGKNHHALGTFGCHVRCFELLRSDGERRMCSLEENPEWFAATIGGLGLTGLIVWAEIQLRPIANPWIDVETIQFGHIDEFFVLSDASQHDYEYTVSWIDCLAKDKHLGRGLFMRGNHAPAGTIGHYQSRSRTFVLTPPVSLVNSLSLKAFNALYYNKQRVKQSCSVQHYESYFYPLDGIQHWNRMYGPRGFYQYQSVTPMENRVEVTRALLREIERSGMGSFLAVLKLFGDQVSPGLMSFPRPGVTLALDFPNKGEALHRLFKRLDAIVEEAGGTLYPAKDGRMSGKLFRKGYPRIEQFLSYVDPKFSSSFWRRVMEGGSE